MLGFHTIDVTIPRDQDTVYKDYYWLCKNGDPKQALIYNKFKKEIPQCNKNKNVLEYARDKHQIHIRLVQEGYEITFIETAYVPSAKLFR